MSIIASEQKGATSKDSTQRQLFPEALDTYLERVLVERSQLKNELARKNKEIGKLRATIQSVLQHLSKVVDSPEKIPHISTVNEEQFPATPDPGVETASNNSPGNHSWHQNENKEDQRKELGKRHRQESSSNLAQANKKPRTDDLSSTLNEYLDRS